MDQEICDCIVPAAGCSARMGSWKPILPFGDRTIVETVVCAALNVCSRVLLVTGYRGAELAAVFKGEPRVVPIENPDWRLGMFSSVRIGVENVRTRRFFVALGDMPWIKGEVYAALLRADEADIVLPAHAGRRGHPVLFHERVKNAVIEADPARGSMRMIAEACRVRELQWPDDSVLRDIDTERDLP